MINNNEFKFGLEAEYLLVNADNYMPLWHQDMSFTALHGVLERISLEDLPNLSGLELEPHHSKIMPYLVEGYALPDEHSPIQDILPKGIEIRTPISPSIEECILCFEKLFSRLQIGLKGLGLQASALSHHPVEHHFEAPQNKRTFEFWQWAMQVMSTYGPDINIGLPESFSKKLDFADLDAKVNYYAPALALISLASPFFKGKLWKINKRVGKSYRTFKRSLFGPAVKFHANSRIEFKLFEMSNHSIDYQNYMLLVLALLLDQKLPGRGDKLTRIYELGAVAQFGYETAGIREKIHEILEIAPKVLNEWGFPAESLKKLYAKVDQNMTPADEIIQEYHANGENISEILKNRSQLIALPKAAQKKKENKKT